MTIYITFSTCQDKALLFLLPQTESKLCHLTNKQKEEENGKLKEN